MNAENKPPFKVVDPTTIDPSTPYGVVDIQTGKIVRSGTYAQRASMRRFADKKDLAYGAVRFVCKFL